MKVKYLIKSECEFEIKTVRWKDISMTYGVCFFFLEWIQQSGRTRYLTCKKSKRKYFAEYLQNFKRKWRVNSYIVEDDKYFIE